MISEKAHAELMALRAKLTALPEPVVSTDEFYGRQACSLAIETASRGNYGVGAIIVSPSGEVVSAAGNRVIVPSFRSDFHAEMLAINEFEERCTDDINIHTLYVSLEPCPMCLARLIIAGIGTVKFVAYDEGGGMVGSIPQMPENFRRLAGFQTFRRADCSADLRDIALRAFLVNLVDARSVLMTKRQRRK